MKISNFKFQISNEKLLLCLIITVFLITRIYKIDSIPPSLYWDEASIGVNGYSILKTGKDEWGDFLPVDFKAFGEYKLPVYIYSTALSIKLFGLNEFAVRIPAVVFSLGTVIFTFLLAKKLYKDYRVGLLAAFFVTTSQWFFIISRTGFEATAGLFFFISGIYFFISGLDSKKIFLILSSTSFILALYSYNSFRVVIPITLVILAIMYFKQLKVYVKKNILLSFLYLTILIIGGFGVVISILSGHTERLDEIGISTAYNQRKYQTFKTVTSNYFSHFNLNFLFFSGDINKRSQIPNFGQINIIYLPLLLLGLMFIFKKRSKEYFLPVILLLIASIPASITRESPHALRSIAAVPFIAFISSLGVLKLASFFSRGLFINLVIICLTLISFMIYFQNFISNYSKQTANDWQYAYKRINLDFEDKFNNFDNIIISDRYNQPYIFTLFYQKIDPNSFRSKAKYNTSIKRFTSLVGGFDKFIFTNID